MNKTEFKEQVAQFMSKNPEIDYQDESEWLKARAREVEVFLTEPNQDSNYAQVLASLDSLTIRDYALGIAVLNPNVAGAQLNLLLKACPVALANAPATILSYLSYSAGNKEQAFMYLSKVRGNYPLAGLIKRVSANWASEQFLAMTLKLHPKVCTSIYGEKAVA
jgi:hypothetical protein